MICLVIYDRRAGRSLLVREYSDAQRELAEDDRLAEDLAAAHSGLDREIVLIEASSLDALRQTHARYFEDLEQIARRDLRPG